MKRYTQDERIVMTLDAGGTHLVFSAMQAEKEIVRPIVYSSGEDNLDKFLGLIIQGFKKTKSKLKTPPSAISFSFPGPADYESGIIGDLENIPCFKEGVALGPMLEEYFKIPVFINNDGDLFAYGEAIAGLLPQINQELKNNGSTKTYKNLLGITIGTGFGGGIIRDGVLFRGDNSAAGEINRFRNSFYPEYSIEESTSIRGVRWAYARESGMAFENTPAPKKINEIAKGETEGDRQAAIKAFQELGRCAGDAIANALSIIDGIVVIGGGISAAYGLFMPQLVHEMNRAFISREGAAVSRMEVKAFNLENPNDKSVFIANNDQEILIPLSKKKISWDPIKRTGVGITKLGTSKAVAIGAYNLALNSLHH